MSHRRIMNRLAIASTVALVAAAPASAMPVDPQGTAAKDPRQLDMHASTVQPQTQSDAAKHVVKDARGEAAAGGGTGGGTSGGPVREPRLQGPPTWPQYPTPLPRPQQQPVPVATDGGDDIGLDLPVALLILAGTLVAGGGMTAAVMKGRTRTRAAH